MLRVNLLLVSTVGRYGLSESSWVRRASCTGIVSLFRLFFLPCENRAPDFQKMPPSWKQTAALSRHYASVLISDFPTNKLVLHKLPRFAHLVTAAKNKHVLSQRISRRKTSSTIIQLKQALFNTHQEDGLWPGAYPKFPKNGPKFRSAGHS